MHQVGLRREEKQASSGWRVLEQNFGDPFDKFTSERLIQVELSRRLKCQVLGPAMSSRRGLYIGWGESFLEVENLGEHEKVLSEKCRKES